MCAAVDLPVLVVTEPRGCLGDLAARLYGNPAGWMRLVGVTGTQGKTTTTRLAEGALTSAGVSAAVIGTLGTRVDGHDVATKLTTPEAPDLHALFAVMRERGVVGCAMEVSSHALVMGRVDGVVFDVAVFTNLGRDHLDFHIDEEDYYQAKASLFTAERARLGLVNIDDAYGRRLYDDATIPLRTFSTSDPAADWHASDIVVEPTGSSFTVHPPVGDPITARVPMPGSFNVANALCAIAALAEAGFEAGSVARAMAESSGVPGRLERVDAGQDFLAVVDYAHKPDAVTAALTALRPSTSGRLVVVIGAGGDRDPGQAAPDGRGRGPAGRRARRHRRQPPHRGAGRDPRRPPRRYDGRARRRARRGARGGRPQGRHPARGVDGVRRGHRRRRWQGTRDRPGGARHRAPLRRPRPCCARSWPHDDPDDPRRDRRRRRRHGPRRPRRRGRRAGLHRHRGRPSSGGLFVAFAGEHVDGHDYAAAAVEAGAAAVLGTRPARRAHGRGRRTPRRPWPALARHVLAQLTGARGRRDHRLAGQDQHQGPARPGARRERADRGDRQAPSTTSSGSRSPCCAPTPSTHYLVLEMGARGIGHMRALCAIAPPRRRRWCSTSGRRTSASSAARQAIAQAKGELVEALDARRASRCSTPTTRWCRRWPARTRGTVLHLRRVRRRRRTHARR